MPQAIPALAVFWTWFTSSAFWAVVARTVVLNAVMSGIARSLTPKFPNDTLSNRLTISYSAVTARRRIILGEMRLSGMETIPPWTSGDHGEMLHNVLTIAGHEVDGYGDVCFNETAITPGQITAITGDSTSGRVTGGPYTSVASIRKYTGAASETVDYILNSNFPNSWKTTAKGVGIAKIMSWFYVSSEAYPTGKPNISAIVRGAKVYDPRLDSTNGGTGSHRVATPSTWEYSHSGDVIGQNPALGLAWYLMSKLGLNVGAAYINWPLIITAANICDEQVVVPLGTYTLTAALTAATTANLSTAWDRASGVADVRFSDGSIKTVTFVNGATGITWSGAVTAASTTILVLEDIGHVAVTQKRYTCNMAFEASPEYEPNIEAICSAMLGCCYWSGGKFVVFAGAWNASSTFDLTDNHLVGDYTTQLDARNVDKYNAVRGTYTKASSNYEEGEFSPRLSSTFESEDGRRKYLQTQFPGCTNEFEAQRNAMVLLRLSRRTRVTKAQFGMPGYNVRPFERGTCTLADIGWAAKNVRVLDWEFNQAGVLVHTLRAEEATDWADPLVTDYGDPTVATDSALVSYVPFQAYNFVATPVAGGIDFTWDAPTTYLSNDEFELWEAAHGVPFSGATRIWHGRANACGVIYNDLTERDFWLVTRNANTNACPPLPGTSGLAATPKKTTPWVPMITNGGGAVMVVSPTEVQKVGGSSAWDSQVYSRNGYLNGALVRFRPNQTDKAIMFGLNSDPATDANFTSIDHCFYIQYDGFYSFYESGVGHGPVTAYTTDTIFEIARSNTSVIWKVDGVVVRTSTCSAAAVFLDSSFHTPGGGITVLEYGPLTSTSMMVDSAATDVYTAGLTSIAWFAGWLAHPTSIASIPAQEASCEFVVTVNYVARFVASANAQLETLFANIYDETEWGGGGVAPSDLVCQMISHDVATDNNFIKSGSFSRSFHVPAGTSKSFYMAAEPSFPGGSFSFDDANMRVEVIKK